MKFKLYHNGKHFVFEGEGHRVLDLNVHALMPKIKRLKIGADDDRITNVKVPKRRRSRTENTRG